jgi:hypothetical protein
MKLFEVKDVIVLAPRTVRVSAIDTNTIQDSREQGWQIAIWLLLDEW